MNGREKLPQRRRCESFDFEHAGLKFTLTLSRFHDGRIAEIFISSWRPGSMIEAIARDAAITASLAFQYGCPLETLRSALTKDHDGGPATLLASMPSEASHDQGLPREISHGPADQQVKRREDPRGRNACAISNGRGLRRAFARSAEARAAAGNGEAPQRSPPCK
jgi:hypothetical protein